MSDEVCYCVAGLHEMCNDATLREDGLYDCCCWSVVEITATGNGRGYYKENDEVKDVLSTGRKRAAEVAPITDGMLCEWAGLRYAGGGVIPIIGCVGTTIVAEKGQGDRTGMIHHGPDKNTLNNDIKNLHRLCATCHNRWHTLNDPYYGTRPPNGQPFLPLERECLPHDPDTKATVAEQFRWEMYWQKPKDKREDIESVNFSEPLPGFTGTSDAA